MNPFISSFIRLLTATFIASSLLNISACGPDKVAAPSTPADPTLTAVIDNSNVREAVDLTRNQHTRLDTDELKAVLISQAGFIFQFWSSEDRFGIDLANPISDFLQGDFNENIDINCHEGQYSIKKTDSPETLTISFNNCSFTEPTNAEDVIHLSGSYIITNNAEANYDVSYLVNAIDYSFHKLSNYSGDNTALSLSLNQDSKLSFNLDASKAKVLIKTSNIQRSIVVNDIELSRRHRIINDYLETSFTDAADITNVSMQYFYADDIYDSTQGYTYPLVGRVKVTTENNLQLNPASSPTEFPVNGSFLIEGTNNTNVRVEYSDNGGTATVKLNDETIKTFYSYEDMNNWINSINNE